MQSDDAIVRPFNLFAGDIGETVVMVSNEGDLLALCDILKIDKGKSRKFLMSRLYVGDGPSGKPEERLALMGPVVGAPYAVLLAETLIASGAENLIYFGWGGSLSEAVSIGDILLPDQALADEGISRNYLFDADVYESNDNTTDAEIISKASPTLLTAIADAFSQAGIEYHQGPIWTTDAIFRETPDKVRHYQQKGGMAVDMEVSALFSVAAFRGIQAAAVLVISDELFDMTWRPGFGDKKFIEARQKVAAVISQLKDVF